MHADAPMHAMDPGPRGRDRLRLGGGAVSLAPAPTAPGQGLGQVLDRVPDRVPGWQGQGLGQVLDQQRVTLRAFPETSQVCRNMARVTALSWGADGDDAQTIAQEISANAVRETLRAHELDPAGFGAPLIVFRLFRFPGRMRVEVWDRAGGAPVMLRPDWESEHGRGLFIVDQLTGGRWGCHPPSSSRRPGDAKCVWADIPCASPSPSLAPVPVPA